MFSASACGPRSAVATRADSRARHASRAPSPQPLPPSGSCSRRRFSPTSLPAILLRRSLPSRCPPAVALMPDPQPLPHRLAGALRFHGKQRVVCSIPAGRLCGTRAGIPIAYRVLTSAPPCCRGYWCPTRRDRCHPCCLCPRRGSSPAPCLPRPHRAAVLHVHVPRPRRLRPGTVCCGDADFSKQRLFCHTSSARRSVPPSSLFLFSSSRV
jgi:hypothetical protein